MQDANNSPSTTALAASSVPGVNSASNLTETDNMSHVSTRTVNGYTYSTVMTTSFFGGYNYATSSQQKQYPGIFLSRPKDQIILPWSWKHSGTGHPDYDNPSSDEEDKGVPPYLEKSMRLRKVASHSASASEDDGGDGSASEEVTVAMSNAYLPHASRRLLLYYDLISICRFIIIVYNVLKHRILKCCLQ
jgi:hypothetical protein